MEETVYHITIKKEYALAVMEELQQNDAITIVQENIPEWQIAKSRKRIKSMLENPCNNLTVKQFFDTLDNEE